MRERILSHTSYVDIKRNVSHVMRGRDVLPQCYPLSGDFLGFTAIYPQKQGVSGCLWVQNSVFPPFPQYIIIITLSFLLLKKKKKRRMMKRCGEIRVWSNCRCSHLRYDRNRSISVGKEGFGYDRLLFGSVREGPPRRAMLQVRYHSGYGGILASQTQNPCI